MSDEFRELLKKVGSGTHTGKDLSRSEATTATMMMLTQKATPAQIGAFTIAHRIKRPTPEELAGMLDAYDQLAAKLQISQNKAHKPVVLGNPYDGRSRTIPVTAITALILASANIPVIMHGGDCMPTKYGIPFIEIWQKLGVDFSGFSQSQLERFIEQTGIGLVYIPQHFPQAQDLVPYREQIGKRPPFATVELIWNPVVGDISLVSGFVHPPTEERFRHTFALRGVEDFTTVKGLEGSCDLACSRTAIIGIGKPGRDFERLLLHPVDYGLDGKDVVLESNQQAIAQMQAVINGDRTSLMSAAILNGGFYLWRFGICSDLEEGFTLAEEMIFKGKIAAKLNQLVAYGND
ncbi:MAG: anthranilate phosphoribosyltransferase family protein [Pleurocapsa sp.]